MHQNGKKPARKILVGRVKRGEWAGERLEPHVYEGGKYVVSMTRYKADQIYLDTMEEVIDYWRRGYGVRMSIPGAPERGPVRIRPQYLELVDDV